MKTIKFKTFFKRCIYSSSSGIQVYQNWLYRWMTFNSRPIQTLINRWRPEKQSLNYLPPMTLPTLAWPGSTCLLGLGGGAIPHIFNVHNPDEILDVCELNEEVANVAKHFFFLEKCHNMNLYIEDATTFVHNHEAQYKHLLIDLFNDKAFPDSCHNQTFFDDCYHLLSKDGVLAINIANSTQQKSILNFLQKQFNQNIVTVPIEHSTNVVILAFKSKSIDEILTLFYQNFKIHMQEWDPEFGYVISI